jgi:hypothetical protein
VASSRFLRSQFRVSGFVSDGRVNGDWVVEWKVVETGPKTPKKHPFIANFWSIPTLASNERSWIPQGFIKAQPPKGREQGQNGGRERFLNCGPRSGVRLGRPQTRQDSTQVAEPHGRFLGQPNRCIQNRKSFPGPDAPPMPPMPDTLLGLLGRIHCQNGEVQFS